MAQFMIISEAVIAFLGFRVLLRTGYRHLYQVVRRWPVAANVRSRAVQDVVVAVQRARALLLFRTHCLEQSAVTCVLLRREGHNARLVIGYRPQPLESHAWVEVNDVVVNDRPQYKKYFAVLDVL